MTKRHFLTYLGLIGCIASSGCFDIEEQITLELVSVDDNQALLSAEMIFRDAPIDDGMRVTFRTDSGSFEEARELQVIEVPASAGSASVTLFRACDLSDATISASYSTINRSTPSAQLEVEFPAAALVTNRDLGFTCAAANIAALDEGLTGETFNIDCNLTAPNRASLQPAFAAEAGSFVLGEAPRSERCGIEPISYRVIVGEDQPQNVVPLPHRCIDDFSYPSAGDGRPGPDTFRNPRDGLVTLVVYTNGAEGFDDHNRNGIWDLGEPFDDLPEPFVDADDNRQWTPGEWYYDVSGNGAWDAGNGRYDDATVIWKNIHMIWSGQPWTADHEMASRMIASPSLESMTPGVGEGRTVRIRVLDRNLNPIAAHGSSDKISVSASRDLELVHGDEAALSQVMGLVVGADGIIDHRIEGSDCAQPVGRSFSARVRDARSDPEECPAALVSVTAEVSYTPAPGIRQRNVALLPLEARLRACNP
jgi:hypothetical protein